MKYLTAICAVVSLITFAVAVPAEPPDRHVFPREEGNYCGKCILMGDDGRRVFIRTSVPPNKCNTLPNNDEFYACTNNDCGLCMMFL
jgi:hypothetical protein